MCIKSDRRTSKFIFSGVATDGAVLNGYKFFLAEYGGMGRDLSELCQLTYTLSIDTSTNSMILMGKGMLPAWRDIKDQLPPSTEPMFYLMFDLNTCVLYTPIFTVLESFAKTIALRKTICM